MFVVHISNSPLVGSPGKISLLLNFNNIESVHYCVNDYPDKSQLHQKFMSNSLLIDFNKAHFLEDIKRADIIHIHNEIPFELGKELFSNSNAQFIYQVHSPLREGPLYLDRSDFLGIKFDKKLVIGQYQPRQYQDYTIVPNIIYSFPSISKRTNKNINIIFSPTHSRTGRWNAKTNDTFDKALEKIKHIPYVNFFSASGYTPEALLNVRRKMNLSIDEVVTGAFHQVSLESLIAGNITVNGADTLSKICFSNTYNCSFEEIPFVYSNPEIIYDTLFELISNVELSNSIQEQTYEFAKQKMDPNILIKEYINVYK